MLVVAGSEVDVSVRRAGLGQQFCGQQLLGVRGVERIDRPGAPAQEDRHPVPVRSVVAQLFPGGRLQRRRVQQAHRGVGVQRPVGQFFQVDDMAIESGLAALAKHGRGQGLGQVERVAAGRLGRGHQDPPRRLHLDGEEPHVVAVQTVLAHDPHQALMRAEAQSADAEIYPSGFVRGKRETLLAPLLFFSPVGWIFRVVGQQEQFDGAFARRAGPRQFAFDSQRVAIGKHLAGEPQLGQRVVVRLLDADVDQVDSDPGCAGQLPLQPVGLFGRPGGTREVGEHVQFLALLVTLAEQAQRIPHSAEKRLRVVRRRELLDPLFGRPAIDLEGPGSGPGVEHGNLAFLG